MQRRSSAQEAETGSEAAFRLSDGALLSYLSFGDHTAPSAIVVPGLTDGLAPVFDPAGAAAVDEPPRPFRRYRVQVVSHRDPMPSGWTTRQMAADLREFLDAVSGPAVLVGHSMGGMVAQHVAADAPELVRGLVLSSTVAAADSNLCRRLDAWDELLRDERWEAFYREAVASSFVGLGRTWRLLALRLARPPARDERLVRRHLTMSGACRTHDARGEVSGFDGPSLVLAGSQDEVTLPERAEELARLIADARLVIVEGAGHALPDQRRRAYVRAVGAFLEECSL